MMFKSHIHGLSESTVNCSSVADLVEEEACVLRDDPRWQAVKRVLRSKTLVKSERMTSFLRYIAEKTLLGQTDEITEQQVGVYVFQRPVDYKPGEDNIVRGTARQLRQKLALYYQEENPGDPIRITIPRGGYVPEFATQEDVTEAEESPNTSPVATAEERPKISYFRKIQLLSCGFVLGTLTMMLAWNIVEYRKARNVSPAHLLWRQIFTPSRPTLIVVGDAGINMFQNLARTSITADEYIRRSYESNPYAKTPTGYDWAPFSSRIYTPFSELHLVASLVALPEAKAAQIQVVFARDLKVDDLRHNNIILLGGPSYEPWDQFFANQRNFRMIYRGDVNRMYIENVAPRPSEKNIYTWRENDPDHNAYALIDLLNNLSGDGKILIVQGTTVAGDEMAADFLQTKIDRSTLQGLSFTNAKPSNFEILLQSNFIGKVASSTKVIASRTYP
jgi:hypothetical protein